MLPKTKEVGAMRFLTTPLTLILDRLQKRFRLSRPGSVLILVVALLVLMALIGTAYISTTRIDRYAVKDNQTSNQVDLAASSLLSTTASAVQNDLYDGTSYRPVSTDPQVPTTYDNWDGVSVPGPSMNLFNNSTVWNNTPAVPIADPNNVWLASRYPGLIEPAQMLNTGTPPNMPVWTSISYPPFQNLSKDLKTAHPNYFWEFRGPDVADNQPGFLLSLPKLYFQPTYKQIGGQWYPALRARLSVSGAAAGGGNYGDYCTWNYQPAASPADATFLAADADGDGIADSGLFPLPIPEIDGVRYYGAIRIIDNNSALNVNTAWAQGDANYEGDRTAWSNDPTSSTRLETRDKDRLVTYDFPSSIDLGSLLRSFNLDWTNALDRGIIPGWQGEEMTALKDYWWDTWFRPIGMDTRGDTTTNWTHAQWPVLDDDGTARANLGTNPPSYEFLYNSIGDAMYQELGRRPSHPGLNFDESPSPVGPQQKSYQAFGSQDAMALAYHFCMINPGAGRSPLEQLFYDVSSKLASPNNRDSIYTTAPNGTPGPPVYIKGKYVSLASDATAYPATPNSVLQWFVDNFDYDSMVDGNWKHSEIGDTAQYHPYDHSRRTMLVTRNPVSNQQPRRNMNGLWDMDVGGVASGAGIDQPAVGPVTVSSSDLQNDGYAGYDGDNFSFSGAVNFVWGEQMPYWNDSTKYNYSGYVPPKASANTASFGVLWRAFWNVMSDGDGTHTPFDDSFAGTIGVEPANSTAGQWGGTPAYPAVPITGDGYTLNDPYVGQKFWDQQVPGTPFLAVGDTYYNSQECRRTSTPPAIPLAVPTRGLPMPGTRGACSAPLSCAMPFSPLSVSVTDKPGQGLEVNQGAAFTTMTPRLPANQEMLLRAAIAAVNTEDLRDSDFDKDIDDPATTGLGATTRPIADPNNNTQLLQGHGTGDVTAHRIVLNAVLKGVVQQVNAVVYGNERQPYITEVFADTDTQASTSSYGYVAIELYNPYDDDIEMTNWKLVALDRRHVINDATYANYGYGIDLKHLDSNPGSPYYLSSPQLIADFDPGRQATAVLSSQAQVYNTDPAGDSPPTLGHPLIVPAHGYLLLENYDGAVQGHGTAGSRPTVSGLPGSGHIPGASPGTWRSTDYQAAIVAGNAAETRPGLPQLNVACVPGLSGLNDQTWSQTGHASSGDDWPPIRSVFNRELVIMRPRRADGFPSKGFYPPLFDVNHDRIVEPMRFDDEFNLSDLVPVDSFDFTGLQLPNGSDALHRAGSLAAIWHYVRQNADAAPATPNASSNATQFEPGQWKFVYPGRYDGCPACGAGGTNLWLPNTRYPGTGAIWGACLWRGRQQGTETYVFTDGDPSVTQWPPLPTAPAATGPLTPITLGATGGIATNNNNTTASYPTSFPIQLHAEGWQVNPLVPTAWNGVNTSTGQHVSGLPAPALFPFGGIARNGDLMQIPFIGAYRISRHGAAGDLVPYTSALGTQIYAVPVPGSADAISGDPTLAQIVELNSITADSVFAEDTDFDDDPRFQINETAPLAGNVAPMGNVDPAKLTSGDQKWMPDTGTTQSREQIGRFCPLITPMRGGDDRYVSGGQGNVNEPIPEYVSGGQYQYAPSSGETVTTNNYLGFAINDYASDPSFRPADTTRGIAQVGADWGGYWRYHWATHLFDFLTVQAPHDDAMADYPIQQPWQFNTNYTVGQVVTYTDRLNPYIPATNVPNPLYMKPCAYVCTRAHLSGTAFVMGYQHAPFQWNQDPPYWHMLARLPQSNSGGKAGNGADPQSYAAEYSQGVEGLININTANWKVLSTLPLVVNPNSGMTVDPNDGSADANGDVPIPQLSNIVRISNPSQHLTYRALNEELAKAIEYYRDVDGQPNPAGPTAAPVLVPHGPFKSLYELNDVVDLRPAGQVDWKFTSGSGNPFYGHGFADAMGLLPMKYLNPDRNSTSYQNNPPLPGDGDPDGGLGDLSPGRKLFPRPLTGSQTDADGVRGDFEEQFLQLDRISNLITTRSDSFTCYVLVQGWKNAGTANASLAVQKRVAYIIDRSMVPYRPEKKTVVPND